MSAIIREAGSHQSDCDTTVTAEEGLTQMSAIIREAGLTVEDLKTLVVSNKHGERGFFIDTGQFGRSIFSHLVYSNGHHLLVTILNYFP